MKLGYIHNNREEQTRVMQVLKMTSESVALDELGIGRIRDAFADRMFPGISTLQKHMKYFSLMPQLYRKATEKRYNRLSEVKAEIIRLERIMTKNLYDGSADKRGITGSEMIGKSGNNYVKYDPAYIYNSGLQTFGILRSPQLYELAENQTKIDDPGYPLDIAVSEDGVVMMVTYQFVDGSDTTSYVAFYNFGDVGQNEDDRIVSGYKYEGVVVPQIQYLSNNRSIALKDNGFTIYQGSQIPKEVKTIETDKEIVSTFYDDDMVGLVFKNDSKDKQYIMEVYNTADGKLKFKEDFNIPYTTIKLSG